METDENLRRRRRIFAVILSLSSALLIITALYLSLVPIDLTRYRSRIESMIESRVSGDVAFEEIVIKFLPSPDVRLKGVTASTGGRPLLKAGSLRARLSLLPLLTGKAVFEDLDAVDAAAFIERDKDGITNLRKFVKAEKDAEKKGRKWKLAIKSFNISGSSIRFTDFSGAAPAVFEVTGIKGYLYERPEGIFYKADGLLLPASEISIAGDRKKEITSGTALLKAFDLKRLNPYLKKAGGNASVSGKAEMSLSYALGEKRLVNGKVVYRGLEAAYPRLFERPVRSSSGSASFNYTSDGKGSGFSITDIKLLAGGSIISGGVNVTGPKENRLVKASASTTPMGLASLKGLLPMKIIPVKTAKRIASIVPLGGAVKLESFSLSADVDTIKGKRLLSTPGAVFAAVTLNDLSFRYPGFKEPFSGVTGVASLENNGVRITGFTGRYNKELVEELKGSLSGLTGALSYDLSLKGVFDADESLGLAKELTGRVEGPFIERLRRANAEGDVILEAKAKGSIKGKKPIEYSGSAKIVNGALSYEPFPVALTSIDGEAGFDNSKIEIRSLGASDGFSELKLKGTVLGYRDKDLSFDLNAEGAASGTTVEALMKDRPAYAGLTLEGDVLFEADAKGRPGSFTSDFHIDTTPAYIKYKELVRKERDYPLDIKGGLAVEGKELSVKNGLASFGSTTLALSGKVDRGTSAYGFSASSERMPLSDLDDVSPILETNFPSGGIVSFSISSSKKPNEAAQYRGGIGVKDGHFKTPLIAMPVERINAFARFDGDRARIEIENLSAGESSLSGAIDVLSISGKSLTFDITSPRLRAEDIFRKKTEAVGEEKALKEAAREKILKEKGEKPAAPIIGIGSVSVAEGDVWNHKFSDLRVEVKFEGKTVHVAPISLTIDGGRATGGVTLYRDPENPLLFEADAKLADIDLGTMVASFGAKEPIVSGPLKGSVTLSGKRGGGFASGLNGKAALVSESGSLWKFLLMSKIFSVLNILSIDELLKEGMPYKSLSGDFSMADGIIKTDNLAFDSDSMRMSAYGSINAPDATIDSVLAVHPFVTIDKIISSIPLAGWIITGKEKSTVSFYFSVEGPLKAPEIDPVPTKSVEESVFGILERLIEAPMELLK